jgi:predicted metal-dependent enzyme (double-stranded beta helix superfamily)
MTDKLSTAIISRDIRESGCAESSVALREFIAGVRRIVRAENNRKRVARAVAELLEPYLQVEELLTQDQMQPDAEKYRQHVLHVENDGSFSIAALVWLPGQETPIHDHVSWCVVGVYKGDEYETRYELCQEDGQTFLVEAGDGLSREGSVDMLVPPGDIHKVTNGGSGMAVSIHIYGADLAVLGCSIRRRYDLPVRAIRANGADGRL